MSMFLLATNGLSMDSISMFKLMSSLKGITCASIYIAYSDAFFRFCFLRMSINVNILMHRMKNH